MIFSLKTVLLSALIVVALVVSIDGHLCYTDADCQNNDCCSVDMKNPAQYGECTKTCSCDKGLVCKRIPDGPKAPICQKQA
ncbi:unnamed protein product [Medioppia subpectinata]|uniref:Uncharacterized protein n=1 Tax=Medioppia subpectinata TaxID=1979941 RepID=A0A7R9PWJ2_9ACAR|nr:unnamed protein product [Medioppia subpectinata]CAG2103785.1 unnamed protein product [Medioppia subpectinata]